MAGERVANPKTYGGSIEFQTLRRNVMARIVKRDGLTVEINPIPSGKLRIRKRPAEGILPDWLEIRHSKRGPYKKHLCV